MGDVFIDASTQPECEQSIRRFIKLLFGNNQITPTRDEYGMYIAKSASLRSCDLSRQVGASIFHPSGEVVTMGCNEVPKAGGGTYWTGDGGDARDFAKGFDPNEHQKSELLVDLLDRLLAGKHLSARLKKLRNAESIGRALMAEEGDKSIKQSKLMDIIEFGRIIHAEMSAISDAARKGLAVQDCTIYCTTFPCHLCAKHIVASGIRRVVYLEPYPKSYAEKLHADSIQIERVGDPSKVSFEAFIGVSPYRYRDLFEKRKRKRSGAVEMWHNGAIRPMIQIYFPSYFQAEGVVLTNLAEKLAKLRENQSET